jgi:hypothetical protein
LHGWNIAFISHVKYLGVIFGKRITWRLHIEIIEAKDLRIFIRIYSLFKSEHLNASTEQISNDIRLPHLGQTPTS